MRRAVFLDRDGVLNDVEVRGGKPYPPPDRASVRILPGVARSLRDLRAAGWLTIVVTNQPDVATGLQTREGLEAIHEYLCSALAIDAIKSCLHVDQHACDCRKPRPGMLLSAAREQNVDLGRSWMVGDRWRDVEAGHAAGCQTIWIDRGYTERTPSCPAFTTTSLPEARDIILAR